MATHYVWSPKQRLEEVKARLTRLRFRDETLAWDRASRAECIVCGATENLLVVDLLYASGVEHFCNERCFKAYKEMLSVAIEDTEDEICDLKDAKELKEVSE